MWVVAYSHPLYFFSHMICELHLWTEKQDIQKFKIRYNIIVTISLSTANLVFEWVIYTAPLNLGSWISEHGE